MDMPRVRDSSGNFTRRLHPISCSISDTLSPVSTVNMVLPQIDEISSFDWVEVPVPDGSTMYCRVASVSTDAVTGQKSVYLEQGACLFDDILIPESTGKTSLSWKASISTILNNIIAKQPSGQPYRWTRGTVQATETIYIEPGGLTLMTALLTMMESIPGYYVEFVQASAADWHIDIKRRPTTAVCEGRLSRNLKTCSIDYRTDSICTRVYCDGVTGGKMDSTNLSTYGVHEESMSLNDGLTKAQKETIVQAYLDAHDHPAVSISISALELSQITGLAFDRFTKGTVCRIVIPWLNITVNEVIVEKSYSDAYTEPENVSISLANSAPDLSIAIAAITGGGGGGKGGTVKQNERFATKFEQTKEYFRLIATDSEWDEWGNSKINVYSQITQTASSIQSVVSRTGYTAEAFFDPSAQYLEGDAVMYQGKMWRFNADHNGPWTGEDVTQITNLYSTITQTESGLRAEVARATAAEGTISSALELKADSAKLSTVMDNNGNVTAASITTAINNGSSQVIIEAEHIELKGEAVAASLASEDVAVTLLSANTVATDNLNALAYFDNPIGWRTFTVDGTELASFIGSDDINFNIADTQTYKNGVSAVINSLSAQRGDYTYTADVSVQSTSTGQSKTKTLTVSAANWTSSGTKEVSLFDGTTELASVSIANPSMGGEWTEATGSGAGSSNIYRVREKDENGAYMGGQHQQSVFLVKGTQSGNSVPISIESYDASGNRIVVAKSSVPVSGGGSSAVNSIAINGGITDHYTSSIAYLSVPVAAYDANGDELKSAILTPTIPSSVYTPSVSVSTTSALRTGGRWIDFTATATATTANGLGSKTETETYTRYIGNYLDEAKADGASEVTLSHQTWGDQSSPTANYTYTLNPGHNRKFQVNASNGQKISCLMTAPSLSASNWTRTNFSRDTQQYNNGKALSIPVSVTVGGVVFSNTFTTAALKVYRYSNAYVSVRFGSTEIGRFYLDSDE